MTASDALGLALAALFAWAGAAKLVDRRTTARSFRALGLPGGAFLATGVPVAELVLAAGLVVVPAVAAPAAVGVLAAFTVVLGRALHDGVAVGCGCFGTARRGPVSVRDLVRNAALGGVGLAVAVDHGTAVAALAAAGAGALVGVVVRPRRQTRVGRPAPSVPGLDYAAAERTVLAFLAPDCQECEAARVAVGALGPAVQTRVIEPDDEGAALFAAFGVATPPVLLTVDRSGTVVDDGLATVTGA